MTSSDDPREWAARGAPTRRTPRPRRQRPLLWTGLCAMLAAGTALVTAAAATPSPDEIVARAVDYWRGDSSYIRVDMTVHRPEWERSLGMTGWTRGREDTLIRFTAPAKDAGNATLKLGASMWIFTPKLNQVIKLPASMMAQSWMGSDFSYNDLAKSDQIVNDYTHRLIATTEADGHTEYTVESTPKPGAPVVWGKQVVRVRDDDVLLEESFFDQDMQLVKRLVTTKIGPLGGRPYPVAMRMTDASEEGHWTELDYREADWDLALPDYLFTLSNLRNPRPWKAP